MGTTARRVGTFVPWVALAAVGVFALILLGRRPVQAPAAPPSARGESAGAVGAPGPAAKALAVARAAETALDDALRENEVLGRRAAELLAERDAAVSRAEGLEASLAVREEKLAAYDATLGEAEGVARETEATLEAMRARVDSLEARRDVAQDPVLRWIREVAAEDPQRQAQALAGVERAKSGDLERFAALVGEDATRAGPVARLLAKVPPSDASDAAVVAVLLAGGDPARVGPAHVVRPSVIREVLERGSVARRRALLAELVLHASRFGGAIDGKPDGKPDGKTDGKPAVATPSVPAGPILAQLQDANLAPLAARLVGILRLEGAAGTLAAALESDAVELRAAAAYALSRIPDREAVEAAARRALPALLDDPSLEVRTAAVLLAEALLGRPVAYDPASEPETRAGERKALLEQLPQG